MTEAEQAVQTLKRIVDRFLGPDDQPEADQDVDYAEAKKAIRALQWRAEVQEIERLTKKPELDPTDLYVGGVAVFARSGGWVSHRDDGVYAEHSRTGAVAVAVGGSAHGNRAMAVEALRTLNQQGPKGLLQPRFQDHEIAQTVNKVTEVAKEFAGHQSLRERIAQVLREALK